MNYFKEWESRGGSMASYLRELEIVVGDYIDEADRLSYDETADTEQIVNKLIEICLGKLQYKKDFQELIK